MTVCIAAICQDSDAQARIVLCFDRKASSELGSSETVLKWDRLSAEWFTLVSGNLSDAREFTEILREKLTDVGDQSPVLPASSMMRKFRSAARVFRRQKMDAYLMVKAGMRLRQFEERRDSRTHPSEYEARLTLELENMPCPVGLILTGFSGTDPYMFQYSNWDFSIAEHFAAIGEGAYMATPILYYRSQAPLDSLPVTLYKVFEAKRLSEVYDSVGRETTMIVLAPDQRLESSENYDEGETEGDVIATEVMLLQQSAIPSFDEMFSRYGPSDISGLSFEPSELLRRFQKPNQITDRPEMISDPSSHGGRDS